MSSVIVRPWSSEDSFEELTELLHRAYAELASQGLRFTATDQKVETTIRRVESGQTWVAEIDGRVVGTITLYIGAKEWQPRYYANEGVAFFGQFGVDPSARGLGIGLLLHQKVVELAREQGLRELALDTSDKAHHLIKLYESWGYKVVDRHEFGGTINYASVIMARHL